jgi:hypothetical protein
MSSQRAPRVKGLSNPSLGDVFRMVWWLQRGFRHGATRGTLRDRILSGVLTVVWWPFAPLLGAVEGLLILRPGARYYVTSSHDAVLAIVARRGTWHVGDHMSSQPGRKQGKRLRAALIPELVRFADERHIAVEATAATPTLAKTYMGEIPGLVDVGPGLLRGRRLRRPPAP